MPASDVVAGRDDVPAMTPKPLRLSVPVFQAKYL